MDISLSPPELRVLGCLIEKELTTPDYYPLSMSALLAACNQKSNRNPVVDYSEEIVDNALHLLRGNELVRKIHDDRGRVARYGHRFTHVFDVDRKQLALLCVLMLRGPQTLGELRQRAGRMHEFESLEEVESTLESLANHPEGALVKRLARQPGTKESRWIHLLSEVPIEEVYGVPAPAAQPAEEVEAEPDPGTGERLDRLEGEVRAIHTQLAKIRGILDRLRERIE